MVLAVLLPRCQWEKMWWEWGRARRLIRKQTWRQSTKMQALPREVYGKIESMREQRLVKQRYPHIHWGVRNLLEVFHRKLCHPSHTLLPTADHTKSMCHTNSDSHMSVSSKVVEMHMMHIPLIYVHLVSSTYAFFCLYACTPTHIDNNYSRWLSREGYKRCHLQIHWK